MLYCAWHMVRRRIAALLAVVCAALGGAAMVTGIGVLADSGWRSHAPVERLDRADVVVSASQSHQPPKPFLPSIALPERVQVPEELADRLARLPGVADTVSDRSFPAAVVTDSGDAAPAEDASVNGHGWSSTGLLAAHDVKGSAPAGPREVALDQGTAAAANAEPGDRVTVVAAGRTGSYRVSAVLQVPGSGVYFTDAAAAGLAAPGTAAGTQDASGEDSPASADLIAVRAEPGEADRAADEVRQAVADDDLNVTTGAARGDAESPGTTAARSLLPTLAASLTGVTLLVVGFIVAGALSVAVQSQRRELALMRAVGATPRQIRRIVTLQAVLTSAAAAVPGAALGYLLAERFRDLLVWTGMLPSGLPLTYGPLPAVAGVVFLVGVVSVAAWCVAWRTSRMPATEAVAESRSEPRKPSPVRARIGLGLIVGGTALSIGPLLIRSQVGAVGTALAGILAAIGLALVGPVLVGRIGRALSRRLPESAPASTWLAVANSHGYAQRAAGAASTLAMAVVFTLTYTLTQTTVVAATSGEVRDATRAEFGVSAPGLGGVPEDLAGDLRDRPGVDAAAPVTTTTALWPFQVLNETEVESAPAMVLDHEAGGVLDLDVRDGDLADLKGRTVAVSADAAESRDVHVGSTVEFYLGDGAPVSARVVATYGRGLGFGELVLSRDLAGSHTTTGLDQQLYVTTDGSEAAEREVTELVSSHPGLALDDDPGAAEKGGVGGVPPQLWINIAVLAVLLAYLLVGIANKLVATTAARRTELATLQLVGATPHQVRAMMRREAALLTVAALVGGLLLSIVPLVLLSAGFLGRPVPSGPAWLLPALAVVVAAIAFLSTELPTRRALRTPPTQALTRT
ncbi:FtsX-like permease family protein [Streptomyces xiaopingdaonensis]|uniref:FtsX-like permease family protein n=1 Tax=Streptomyces xiaopingdaonensis TaxID=1565415 RepID=UPI000301412D|nr:FtsX-like permease family protein [Streptomyces xiaopingdaonensis]